MTKEDLVEGLVKRYEDVGIKVSKEVAWKAFREGINAVVDVLLANRDEDLALSGVGKFEILKAGVRKSKIGLVDFVPRLRFRPSTRINAVLEEAYGQIPDPTKLEAKRQEMRDAGIVPNFGERKAKEPKAETPAPAKPAATAKLAATAKPAKPAATAKLAATAKPTPTPAPVDDFE